MNYFSEPNVKQKLIEVRFWNETCAQNLIKFIKEIQSHYLSIVKI